MESLLEASDYIHMIQKRQGVEISAPEEIAYRYEWINREMLIKAANKYGKSPYGQHLLQVAIGKYISTVRR